MINKNKKARVLHGFLIKGDEVLLYQLSYFTLFLAYKI